MKVDISKNYYEILGIEPTDDLEEIKFAYLTKSGEAHRILSDVEEAYTFLKIPGIKVRYDHCSPYGSHWKAGATIDPDFKFKPEDFKEYRKCLRSSESAKAKRKQLFEKTKDILKTVLKVVIFIFVIVFAVTWLIWFFGNVFNGNNPFLWMSEL